MTDCDGQSETWWVVGRKTVSAVCGHTVFEVDLGETALFFWSPGEREVEATNTALGITCV